MTEPGTVKIDADIENFHGSKIKGAKENELYNSFAEVGNKVQKKIRDDLTQKYGVALVNNRNPDTSDIKYRQLLEEYRQMS